MKKVTLKLWLGIWACVTLICIALSGCGGGGGGAVGGSGEPPAVMVSAPSPVEPPAASAAGDCTIAYWGDSISALTAPHVNPRITVRLHAVVGGTAQAALPTFLQDPLTEPIIVIEYGANDANGGSDLYTPLLAMIARAKSLGRTVVLTGLSRETAGNAALQSLDNTLVSQQAGPGVVYVDWPSVAYAAGDLMPDGVHPQKEYQQRLADALSTTILGICSK